MSTLLKKLALVVAPKKQRIAESKRDLERRLRAGGLSRSEAKRAAAARFSGNGE